MFRGQPGPIRGSLYELSQPGGPSVAKSQVDVYRAPFPSSFLETPSGMMTSKSSGPAHTLTSCMPLERVTESGVGISNAYSLAR
jgi:hypothetical protein